MCSNLVPNSPASQSHPVNLIGIDCITHAGGLLQDQKFLRAFSEEYNSEEFTLEGIPVTNPGQEAAFNQVREWICDDLQSATDKRFKIFRSGKMKKYQIFEHSSWPKDAETLATCGDKHLEEVLGECETEMAWFGANREAATRQWSSLKVHVMDEAGVIGMTF